MNDERDEGFVTIREYLVPLEAEWARNVLAQAGICCFVPEGNLNLSIPGTPVRLQVPAPVADEAEAVLEEMELHRRPLSEGDDLHGTAPGEEGDDGSEEPSEVEALDPHDLCPIALAPPCPACGAAETASAPPPDYAGENRMTDAIKRFAGHGWYRCASCGHVWEI